MADTEVGDRIAALLAEFKLSSAAEQMIKRFLDAGCDQALVLLAEVLEVEAHARRERRVERLRRTSHLPPAACQDVRYPRRDPRAAAGAHPGPRARAGRLRRAHLACALGHALVGAGISVLFTPTYQLVQQLLAARRDLMLPRALRTLDAYDVMILDDLEQLPAE